MEIDCAKKRGDSHSFVTTDTYVVKFKFLDLKIKPFDISNRLRFIKCFAGWPGLQVVFFEDLLEKRCVAANISVDHFTQQIKNGFSPVPNDWLEFPARRDCHRL